MDKRLILPLALVLALASPASQAAPKFASIAAGSIGPIPVSSSPACPKAEEPQAVTTSDLTPLFQALISSPQPILRTEAIPAQHQALILDLARALEVSPGQLLGAAEDSLVIMEINRPLHQPASDETQEEFTGRTLQFLKGSKRAAEALLSAQQSLPEALQPQFERVKQAFEQGPISEAANRLSPLIEHPESLPTESYAWLKITQAALYGTDYNWAAAVDAYTEAAEAIEKHDATLGARFYEWATESAVGDDRLDQGLALAERGLTLDSAQSERLALLAWKALLLDDTEGREAAYPAFAEVITGLKQLGSQLREAGRWAEAEIEYKKLLTLSQIYYGPDHKQIGGAQNELAITLFMQGKFSDALPLMEQSLDSVSRHYGPDHPETQGLRQNLAHMRQCMEQAVH